MLTWHYFAIATVLTGSIADIIIRVLMNKEDSDPILFSIVFQFLLSLIILVFVLTQGTYHFPSFKLFPRFLLGGVFYAAGSFLLVLSSKKIPAGEKTIIFASGSIISVLLGVFVLGNTFGIYNIFGLLFILLAIVVLYGKSKMKMSSGVWYALAGAFFFAVAVINDVIILKSTRLYSFLPLMSFLPGVVLVLVFPTHLHKIKRLANPKAFSHIFIYSLMYAASAITYYSALNAGASISQLSPITRASIIVTVLLAALFLGERSHLKRKLVSAALVSSASSS